MRIIVHPGRAHFDEMCAVALISTLHEDISVERKEPTLLEIMDPEVWVVDVGGEHNISRHNFDHHQDAELSASFILVAEYLNLDLYLEQLMWWKYKNSVDLIGPMATDKKFGRKGVNMQLFPIETFVVESFQKDPNGMVPFLRAWAKSQIEYAHDLQYRIKVVEDCTNHLIIKNLATIVSETDDVSSIYEYKRIRNVDAAISVSFDGRGEGWTLYRFDDHPNVDFLKIEEDDRIEFVANSGFIAKTKTRLDWIEVQELIEHSIKD